MKPSPSQFIQFAGRFGLRKVSNLQQSHPKSAPNPKLEPRSLSVGYLTRFSLPLALTFLMMSGAAPLVSNGITWAHGSEGESLHLSAFLMTFALSVFCYSPVFTARNVANRTIIDRPSLYAFARFYLLWGTIGSGLILLLALHRPSTSFVLEKLLSAPPRTVDLVRSGMLVFTPIPILIALRGMGQGCHITNGQTTYVGIGTLLRFTTMAVFIFGYAVHHSLSGPVLGGLTYLFGISAETVFVLFTLRGKTQWTQRYAITPPLAITDFFLLAGPLLLATVLQQILNPILIYLINISNAPAVNGATFNLVRDTVWILVSIMMTIQSSVISFATSWENFRLILRFAIVMWLAITGIAIVLAFTPLKEMVFVGWLQVDNQDILKITYQCLRWMVFIPIATVVYHFVVSLHTRSGRTGWVTLGNITGLLVIILIPRMLDLQFVDGAVLAIIANAVFMLSSAAIQGIGFLRGGFSAALTPLDVRWGRQPHSTPPAKVS